MSEERDELLPPAQRILLLCTVVVTNTLYSSTILISSALLPQLQGALLATQDEVSWTMTFNIVAGAVATPTSGWLSARFGQKTVLIACVWIFSFATLMCGASSTLEEMVLWRIVQGAAGAPMVPLGQTLLLNGFPPHQLPNVQSIYGMANMVGPVLGPMVAGEIAESYGWRWAFWMVLPVSAVALAGLYLVLPKDKLRGKAELEWTGFLTLSIAVGAAQFVLSRGPRLDWFESSEIALATFIAGLAFYVYFAHTLTAKKPFLDLRVLRDRNYIVGSAMVFLFGALSFAPIILLPPLLQQHAGYTDSAIGHYIAWRGLGAMLGFFVSMLAQNVDRRLMLFIGTMLQTACGLWILSFNLDVDITTLAMNSVLQGVCIGLFWAPMSLATFSTLPAEHRPTGMALFHLLRTFGSSMFIAVAVAEVVHASGANYARLSQTINPFNRVLDLPASMGGWSADSITGLAKIAREIDRQSTMIGYTNAFLLYTLVAVMAIPLSLMLRAPRPPAARAAE